MGKMDRSADNGHALSSPDLLKQHINRILHLREEVKGLNSDISDTYKQAESDGFDKEAVKYVVKRADQDRDRLETLESLVHLYEGIHQGKITVETGTRPATRTGARQRLDA